VRPRDNEVDICANCKEDKEAIMTKFMNELNHDITYIMELHHYLEFEVMVRVVLKMEKKLK
jgi:hypothetical protein